MTILDSALGAMPSPLRVELSWHHLFCVTGMLGSWRIHYGEALDLFRSSSTKIGSRSWSESWSGLPWALVFSSFSLKSDEIFDFQTKTSTD